MAYYGNIPQNPYSPYYPSTTAPVNSVVPNNYQGTYQGAAGRYIPGQVVNALTEISPADVPMAGESWFPYADGSKIVAKRWNSDGTIATRIYILTDEQAQTDPMKSIEERIARIEKDLYSEKEGLHERQH